MRPAISSWFTLVTLAGLAATAAAIPAAPTAPTAAAARPLPADAHLVVRMERTACMGACPQYVIAIYDDGTVAYRGTGDVAVIGERRATITARQVAALEAAFVKARFAERDDRGRLPAPSAPTCVTRGHEEECTFGPITSTGCTDTPHAILSFQRHGQRHQTDDAHCETSSLDALEELVDRTAGVAVWVGRGAAR